MSPRGTLNETFFSAAIPPNSIPTFRTTSSGFSPRASDAEYAGLSDVQLPGGLSIDSLPPWRPSRAIVREIERSLRHLYAALWKLMTVVL
jgi:hypothetical protein